MLEQGVSRIYGEVPEASNGTQNFDDDGHVKRTGTMWTASAHIITAVIGSGVLSMAWAIAQLGWIAAPSSLILFSVVTYYTSGLLAACYRTGDPITGNRNYTYMHAVRSHLGRMNANFCGCVQYANLFGVAIGYTIAASISMMAVKRSNCYHNSGGKDSCKMNSSVYMISFGIAEIVLSQIPDFDQFWWLSIVAAVMSFTYSAIGLGLGIAKVIGNRMVKGSLTGVSIGVVSETQKIWRTFQALGNIAFAYSYSMILIEIQDTIKSPPEESKTMSKATLVSVLVTSIFYLLCGGFGYAAFGDSSPGNLLTGFGFYNPYWLLDIANVAIVVHLVSAYQVDCQPLFRFIEKVAAQKFPDSDFITKEFEVRIPGCKPFKLNLFRLVWRTILVICCTVIAMLLPFFTDIVGLIGAIAYWSLTVYFPVEMYIVQTKIRKWSTKWIGLQMLSAACFVLAMVAAVGSIAGVLDDLKVYKPFMTDY
ncbi:amino acid permease 3-like [Vigna radiata var. radiata]|uniref:Amino acid permease 3-like n=1 Tax=Vigna radiata var. radiata TaxID=3916 RepID=A0A1S3UB91_VIGRR|nr:amino acid permease 3-like [Vigna radiata var. radiata]